MMFNNVSAVRISRTSCVLTSGYLCHFALWTAFPFSLVGRLHSLFPWRRFYSHDYYWHSVTLGLAPFRQSRVPSL